MNLFDNVSIRWSLIGTFFATIILLISFGLFSLSEMETLGDLTATLYEHPLRVSNAALEAQKGVIIIHRDMKDVVLSKNQQELLPLLGQIETEEERVYAKLAIVKQYILGQEGQMLVNDAIESFSAWKAIRHKVVFLYRTDDVEGAVGITRGEGARHVQLLEKKMSALTQYARKKADGFMENAIQVQKDIRKNTIGALFLFSFVLLMCWLGLRHIFSRMADFQAAISSIDVSHDLTEVEIVGNNEIASLGRSFNVLVSSLRRQFWLHEGLNLLSERLITVDDLEDFKGILSFLARYANAAGAVLYSYDSEQRTLSRMAAYALPEGYLVKDSVQLGQGIVGQVAQDESPIYIVDDLADGIVIESATGSLDTRAIYALPLIFKNELIGVVEYAFAGSSRAMDREFLRLSSDFVAGALLTVMSRIQVEHLLQEATSTNRTLERKTSELEEANQTLFVRNDELDRKSNELETKTEDLSQLASQLSEQKVELEIKQKEAEEADKLKSEFLSNMSHELRTPLNSILALSQLMIRRRQDALSAKETEYVRVIEQNGHHLLSLINNILDLSKIESGHMELFNSEFDIASVVQTVVETMLPLARDKGLVLNSDLAFDGMITSDRSKVYQVLLNLVSNGVKFTESGHVDISLIREGDVVLFSVSDTGIGIHPDMYEAVFDQFKQVDGSTTRKHGGSGLGLTISRNFARMMGGDIWVESSPSGGSRFVLQLPCKAVTENMAETPSKEVLAEHNNKTVLVVDDLKHHRGLIRAALEGDGYAVIECDNGKEAIEVARRQPIHAITLDVLMPEMDGWETLRILKEHEETKKIPVVMVSINADQTTGMALGAEAFLVKPLDRAKLLACLTKVGNAHRASHVLVIDDEIPVLDNLKETLQETGYNVSVADDGQKGLDIAKKDRPDVILLDLKMPGMSGNSVLAAIREDEGLRDVPVIILTGLNLNGDERGELLGLTSGILQKGESLDEVIATISREIETLYPFIPSGKKAHKESREKTIVLAVEDNEANVMVLREIFDETPWDLTVAVDGEQGVDIARRILPDLILMDLHLPGISGYDAIRLLKADPVTRDIPIIVLTAQAMEGDREKSLAVGCDDYLAKPYDTDTLLERIRQWLT